MREVVPQDVEDRFSLQKEAENADDDKEDADDRAEVCAKIKACFREENGRMRCIHCSRTLSCKSGPSTQKYHVNTSCKVLVHRTQKPAFPNNRANALLCRMITEDCLSLRLTESPNLRAFVDYLRPGYQPPSRTTLTKTWLPKVKASLKKRMVEKLGTIEYFSLSFDGWTNIVARKFIAVLRHGITTDWKLETFLLKIASVTESETAEFIARIVRGHSKHGVSLWSQ